MQRRNDAPMRRVTDFLRYAIDSRKVKRLVLLIQSVVLLMLVGCRSQLASDINKFQAREEALKAAHWDELATLTAKAEAGIYATQYLSANDEMEAEPLARWLGCLDELYPNLTAEQKAHACWGPICRRESPDYPDSMEWVLLQPGQFEEYDPEQPITEENYVIACNQLSRWRNGDIRPVGEGAVYITISDGRVELRDHWDPKQAKKWRVE